MDITRTDLVIPTYEHPDGLTARVRDQRVQITFSDIQGTTTLDLPLTALDALGEVGMAIAADRPAPEPAADEPGVGDADQEPPVTEEPQEEP